MPKRQQKVQDQTPAADEVRKRPRRDVKTPKSHQDVHQDIQEKVEKKARLSPTKRLELYRRESETLAEKLAEQDEELRSLRGAADTRNELEERLHKSNLQLTITQTELMSLKEDYGKIKKRFPDEQNKENHTVCSGKFVVDIDGRIHNESAMIVLDMARLEEENLQLKAELAERQLKIKSFLAEESQTVNVVDEWKVSLRWEFSNVHKHDCERRKVKEGRMRCREFGIHWKFELEVPSDLLQKLGRGRASLPDRNAVVIDQWMFQEMDRRHLVWPSGEKQLTWLVTSLSNLSKKALKKIKAIDKLWMEELEDKPREGRKVEEKDRPVMFNGRQLSTLDCAFLARLLVSMKGELINLTNPPQALPNDFQFDVSLDTSPSRCCD